MKRLKSNPFEIFGLTPQFIKDFDDETLFKIIKKIYKILQMSLHPDRGGDPRKALELNLAYESINLEKNPQSFQKLKQAYLQRLSRKTLKKEVEDLKEAYRKLLFLNELLKERFWLFLEKDNNFIKNLYNKGLVLKINILDIIAQLNFGKLVNLYTKKKFFKELIITPEMILKRVWGKEKYQIMKNYKFLGSVKREHISPWLLLEREVKDEKFYLRDRLSKETFIREVLVFLNPEIKPNHYLFFSTPMEPQKIFFEGLVIKLEEITQLEYLQILQHKSEKSDITIERGSPDLPDTTTGP